ncbi:hypothetical protein D3C86_1801510 [compost metagenome]
MQALDRKFYQAVGRYKKMPAPVLESLGLPLQSFYVHFLDPQDLYTPILCSNLFHFLRHWLIFPLPNYVDILRFLLTAVLLFQIVFQQWQF